MTHSRLPLFVTVLTALLALILAGCTAGSTPTAAPLTDEPAEPPTQSATEAASPQEVFSVTVTDGQGDGVTLDHKPERIVSLTLGTDEVLLDLVGPERLIAVTYLAGDATTSNIADRPELAQIANQIDADPETIIALEPDLVFMASWADPAIIDQLRNAGLTVFVVGNFTSIEAMEENILTLGALVGEPERAQAMVDDMQAQLDEIAAAVEGVGGEKPSVMYLASGGWVAGSATTVEDIIRHAGGINAGTEYGLADWVQVSEEAILAIDPDIVILSPYVTDDEFIEHPVFSQMRAVTEGRTAAINDATMSATSQYIVLGVRDMASVLYPGAVEPAP